MKKIIAFILTMSVVVTISWQSVDTVYAATNGKATLSGSKSVVLSESKLEIEMGQTYQLTCKGVKGSVKWKSSNQSVATVNQRGMVTAKNPGKTTIILTGEKIGTLKCVVQVKITQEQVYERILALEKTYPEGTPWTNEGNKYYWSAINCDCCGCIAFAGEVSDKVFGKNAKMTRHKVFDKIKVGDHIRIGGYHSVIVLSKEKDSITVVEGNYNASVHWGREITRDELESKGFYVDSRY